MESSIRQEQLEYHDRYLIQIIKVARQEARITKKETSLSLFAPDEPGNSKNKTFSSIHIVEIFLNQCIQFYSGLPMMSDNCEYSCSYENYTNYQFRNCN